MLERPRMHIRWIGCAAGVALVAACGETLAPPPAPPVNWASFDHPGPVDAGPNAPTRPEMGVAPAYIAGLASPGFSGLAARLDLDCHFAFPGTSDVRGREAVVRAHETLLGAFDPRDVAQGRVWRTSSTQAVEWTFRGTQARDWMGVAATQKEATVRGVALLWTKDDGSITDVHLYFGVGDVRAQLGAAPDGTSRARTEGASAARQARARGASDTGDAGDASAPGAVASPPATFDQTGADDERANVAAYRATLDALEGSDDAKYLASMADDVEIAGPDHAPARGKAAARAYFRAMHAAIGQLDTTVTDAWGIGPYAVVEYTIAGVQLGPIGWVPAQHDKAARLHVVDIVEFAHGHVQSVWRYQNLAELVGQPS